AEGLPWLERAEVLTFEEIERLVALLAEMGVRDLRLTGGEPLVRREFPRLASMLAPLVDDLSVTTNGFLLERDAEALVRAGIDAVYPLEPEPREPSATARVYRFADGRGRIGFINPVSEPFCGDCDRVRLTADGKLRTCLFSLRETDLRGPMRAGADDAEL